MLTFLNPARDPLGAGYHITQSKIAIGSGGVFGKGWLNGSQAHLNFLPESDTDFIFAVYAEETGLFGVLGLMAIYGFIVARGLFIAVKSQDTFQRLTAASLVADVLLLCIRQHGHGRRAVAGGRCAAAADLVRWHVDGHAAGLIRDSDVDPHAQEVARHMTIAKLEQVLRSALVLPLVLSLAAPAALADTPHGDYAHSAAGRKLIDRLHRDKGIPKATTRKLLEDARYKPEIVAKMRKPAEKTLTWADYRPIFVQPKRARQGAAYINAHRELFEKAQAKYGVPAYMIAAILGVETRYGRYVGKDRVLDALSTLAFDYPGTFGFLHQGTRRVHHALR